MIPYHLRGSNLHARTGSRLRRLPAGVLMLVALLGSAATVHADLLVTRDGSTIEIQGSWEVRGRLVIFTRSDGQLSSLRLSDVDLDASRQATARARDAEATAAATQPAPEGARKKAAVLTDKDFRIRRPLLGLDEPASGEEGDGTAAAEVTTLTVTTWDRREDPIDGHISLVGNLRNGTGDTATNITLKVRLFDDEGNSLEAREAQLEATALAPGRQTGFLIDFPDVFNFAAVHFETESLKLKTQAPEGTPASEAGTGEAEPETVEEAPQGTLRQLSR